MDAYEATKAVFLRIQSLDPENASKIMGLLLIQDSGEKEMIRLAFGPESLLHSVVLKARHELGVSSSRLSLNTPPASMSLSTLAAAAASSSSANAAPCDSSGFNPWTPPFYNRAGNLLDDLDLEQLYYPQPDHPPPAPAGASPIANWADAVHASLHRRSASVSDINLGLGSFLDDPASGLGWKPCLYYAKGFCKNGSACKFVHDATIVGSPSKLEMMDQCHELLRSKSMQHQKLMAAMASAPGSPTLPFKGLSLFSHHQNDSPRAAAALMMGEDLHKFGRSRLDSGRADLNPASRQIYLTFPADSTFREEDVSNYFSIYGPVQDVRIPYQQKRMFGFVTFVYPETVKIILAKGNPHFVCDARVLVKPYKEKGKVPDKFRKQQQMERGEFSACNSPTALDSRDPFDLQIGGRMGYDTQYMLWRRKLAEEQADLQQALELQSRRLMGLQLPDLKTDHHHHRSLSTGARIPSPIQSPNSIFNQTLLGSDPSSPDDSDENCASPPLNDAKQALQQAINEATDKEKESSGREYNNNNGIGKEGPFHQDNNFLESFEHNLPDSPFASPTKGAGKYMMAFTSGSEVESTSASPATSAHDNSKASAFSLHSTSPSDIPPFKSCYFQMPRFSSSHGAIGM